MQTVMHTHEYKKCTKYHYTHVAPSSREPPTPPRSPQNPLPTLQRGSTASVPLHARFRRKTSRSCLRYANTTSRVSIRLRSSPLGAVSLAALRGTIA